MLSIVPVKEGKANPLKTMTTMMMMMMVNDLVPTTIVDVTMCYPSLLLKPQKTKNMKHALVVAAAVLLLLFCCIFLMNKDDQDNDKQQ